MKRVLIVLAAMVTGLVSAHAENADDVPGGIAKYLPRDLMCYWEMALTPDLQQWAAKRYTVPEAKLVRLAMPYYRDKVVGPRGVKWKLPPSALLLQLAMAETLPRRMGLGTRWNSAEKKLEFAMAAIHENPADRVEKFSAFLLAHRKEGVMTNAGDLHVFSVKGEPLIWIRALQESSLLVAGTSPDFVQTVGPHKNAEDSFAGSASLTDTLAVYRPNGIIAITSVDRFKTALTESGDETNLRYVSLLNENLPGLQTWAWTFDMDLGAGTGRDFFFWGFKDDTVQKLAAKLPPIEWATSAATGTNTRIFVPFSLPLEEWDKGAGLNWFPALEKLAQGWTGFLGKAGNGEKTVFSAKPEAAWIFDAATPDGAGMGVLAIALNDPKRVEARFAAWAQVGTIGEELGGAKLKKASGEGRYCFEFPEFTAFATIKEGLLLVTTSAPALEHFIGNVTAKQEMKARPDFAAVAPHQAFSASQVVAGFLLDVHQIALRYEKLYPSAWQDISARLSELKLPTPASPPPPGLADKYGINRGQVMLVPKGVAAEQTFTLPAAPLTDYTFQTEFGWTIYRPVWSSFLEKMLAAGGAPDDTKGIAYATQWIGRGNALGGPVLQDSVLPAPLDLVLSIMFVASQPLEPLPDSEVSAN